jgi:hypothetical protein
MRKKRNLHKVIYTPIAPEKDKDQAFDFYKLEDLKWTEKLNQ